MTGPDDFAIVTHELTRRFGDQFAVNGVALHVPRGAFYGFVGPNGAGKSTTINILTGMLAQSAGTARILGLDLDAESLAIKRRIGVVPDGPHLFDRLTGAEQLRFAARIRGLDRRTADQRTDALLGSMDLLGEAGKLIGSYSHGMRKKLSLACALIHNPELLFLDEPFEGIDVVATRHIRDILARLIASGHTTVFLTSHILEVVEKLCTHIGIIAGGRLALEGALDALRAGDGGHVRTLEDRFLEVVGAPAEKPALDWLGAGERT
jgi:ABC-2 type transport system ATP-binding protein